MWRPWVFTGIVALLLPAISGVISFQDVKDLRRLLRKLECENAEFGNEKGVLEWLDNANKQSQAAHRNEALAEWKYTTDLTDENSQKLVEAGADRAKVDRKLTEDAQKVMSKRDEYECYSSDTRRQLKLFAVSEDAKDPKITNDKMKMRNEMLKIYNGGKVCNNEKCLELDPDLKNIIARSRDPEKLLWAWKGWRDAVGRPIGALYPDFVHLVNIGARDNGFKDYGDFWRVSQFGETEDLEDMFEKLWQKLKPLYEQLHAYVHRKLIMKYGHDIAGYEGEGIPAHLLGDMWSQQWPDIFDIVVPYREVSDVNVTTALEAQGYTAKKIFKTAEGFFTSIGFPKMTDTFWKESVISKPADKKVVCHGSASDMYAGGDFRIKMCTEPTSESFQTVHHEMGHIEYFMVYAHQPFVYRNGANSGFHEAVGDTIGLSVLSRKHLKTIHLLKDSGEQTMDEETKKKMSINKLMKTALQKIAFLPYGYLIDKWRWDVFRGRITPQEYNKEYWNLRLKYQGVVSPVPRNADDFDPGAKFHVADNDYYVCYFASFILQFQFYEALCNASGHTGPLHECDFYKSKEAGQKLKDMLSLGASKPWPEALKMLTGKTKISPASIERYFEPLIDWLKEENKGKTTGWEYGKINWQDGWS